MKSEQTRTIRTYSFEKLDVWQKARILRKDITILTRAFPKEELYGLTSQIKRSASSIGDCIAEGSGRITSKDKAHYTVMAYGSALETINHLVSALDLGYIVEEAYTDLRIKIDEITYRLNSLRISQLKGV